MKLSRHLRSIDTPVGAIGIHALGEAASADRLAQLPFSLKILLENLLRHEDGRDVTEAHIKALVDWKPKAEPDDQIAFAPARVVLQDFTGVPAVVDLAVMRDAMADLGGDPARINPQIPVDLVIDHSVMVDHFAQSDALDLNTKLEFQRNKERYEFLRWGQEAFDNFRVVPPGTGIVHQVNLEFLADVVMSGTVNGQRVAWPDTLVGTDSHTTMINGLGVLGWGVGGIEAEAAMLGQPVTMLIPQVVGFHLHGQLPAGTTATDLVLTVTQMLREKGVVGRFVEFFGDGLEHMSLADRATISNMAPEYGATCGIFPVDSETLRYLELTGRDADQIKLVEAYCRAQGLWREPGQKPAEYTDTLELDLSRVVPSLAGPKRPQDRVALTDVKSTIHKVLEADGKSPDTNSGGVAVSYEGENFNLDNGDVVIAAITSCTNTSNPAVLMAAGLLAKKAREKGLTRKPWVKTSLAPGSQSVPQYLENAGLLEPLRELGFWVVGYGCTTCIGNSGPLPDPIAAAITEGDLTVCSVLSGNRNFEGRIHAAIKANFLASPPLVVAYALAGSLRVDLAVDPLGTAADGSPVYLKDIWPSQAEVNEAVASSVTSELFRKSYSDVFKGSADWQKIAPPQSSTYNWPQSTYIAKPPYFDGIKPKPGKIEPIENARVLVKVGDSITTDHISPAGAIAPKSPAGQYLQELQVRPAEFNSLGSRRGNHNVMMRGTFANVRLKNEIAPGTEGSATRHLPDGEQMDIYSAGMRYQEEGVPLIVLAGKEYGTGSSRDWAAKGTQLLGIRAVLAESFERIHRSNLVGFGVLPLQYQAGDSGASLGLTGEEQFTIGSVEGEPSTVEVVAKSADGAEKRFTVDVRVDTPTEWDYYRHGGILHYVLRDLAEAAKGVA